MTFSREVRPELKTVVCSQSELDGVLRKHRDHRIVSITPVGSVTAGQAIYGSNEIRTEVRFAVVIALAPRMEVIARQLARDGQI